MTATQGEKGINRLRKKEKNYDCENALITKKVMTIH
jgi:hypothetical protein